MRENFHSASNNSKVAIAVGIRKGSCQSQRDFITGRVFRKYFSIVRVYNNMNVKYELSVNKKITIKIESIS